MSHGKDFDQREASARETAKWLLPNVHRAEQNMEREMMVPVRDMKELLSYIDAAQYKEKVEFQGKRLGFCDPDEARDLLTRKEASLRVLFKQTNRYCVEVSFRELPPKNLDECPLDQGK
ncbi:hypothetical protein D9M71_230030 [compost metagenome]